MSFASGLEVITQEDAKAMSFALYEKLASDDPYQVKEAKDAITDFTRTRVREDGFYRKVMPMVPVTNDKLDRQYDSESPSIVIDREGPSPAAISIGFNTLPQNLYMLGERYVVAFGRISTPRFTKDVDLLRTWVMDLRQVLSDNAIKDILAEEDSKFLRAVNSAIVGPGMVVRQSGTVQYEQIAGAITPETLWESLKIVPNTPSSLEVQTVLLNNITIKDVCKFNEFEGSSDIVAGVMRDGWTMTKYLGTTWMITIKKGLVATNTMYHFADPTFMGKSFSLEDVVMYIERKAFMLEFFAYEFIGGAIGNTSSVARVDFLG